MCESEEREGTLIDWMRESRMNLKEYMREVMNRDREGKKSFFLNHTRTEKNGCIETLCHHEGEYHVLNLVGLGA